MKFDVVGIVLARDEVRVPVVVLRFVDVMHNGAVWKRMPERCLNDENVLSLVLGTVTDVDKDVAVLSDSSTFPMAKASDFD